MLLSQFNVLIFVVAATMMGVFFIVAIVIGEDIIICILPGLPEQPGVARA